MNFVCILTHQIIEIVEDGVFVIDMLKSNRRYVLLIKKVNGMVTFFFNYRL